MPNHLSEETSPYLLQHVNNPVDWYPWNETSLTLAREQNKPILLSIGYSACHWCHVMAHESFENDNIARVMNDLFINIKVDREERPDLDKIYQNAHQLLNQRGGGWPLTVFLTPDDHMPFFAGTYFPPEAKHGMPGFTEVLQHISKVFQQHPHELQQQNQQLQNALNNLSSAQGKYSGSLSATPLDQARGQLASQYDAVWGGFGKAPKFPHPTNIERLLRHWAGSRTTEQTDTHAFDMAMTTLHAMASGGIYDQLGGGFFRYSVDEKWHIPHFEKMLYDNGPLIGLYCDAWLATGQDVFKRIITETARWVIREMQSSEGGYFSTLDADSEGEEGLFYCWTPEQIKNTLPIEQANITRHVYGLDQPANFEQLWHLVVSNTVETFADDANIELETQYLAQARQSLFSLREQRIKPARDEKILTAWNGLMIKGMAKASRTTQTPEFIASAHKAIDFIQQNVFSKQRLNAVYQGNSKLMGYLDDYVFLIDGILESLQTCWRSRDLEFAITLTQSVLEHFEDKQNGGFYFTANDHENLIHRPKPMSDEAIPSGNGIAAQVLLRLGHLLGEPRYIDAALNILQLAWNDINQYPYAHCALLTALEEYLYPPELIILRGDKEEMQPWFDAANKAYHPDRMVFAIPATGDTLPGQLDKKVTGETVQAYCCKGMSCQPPLDRLENFVDFLKNET